MKLKYEDIIQTVWELDMVLGSHPFQDTSFLVKNGYFDRKVNNWSKISYDNTNSNSFKQIVLDSETTFDHFVEPRDDFRQYHRLFFAGRFNDIIQNPEE